jgi:hypothetical protein
MGREKERDVGVQVYEGVLLKDVVELALANLYLVYDIILGLLNDPLFLADAHEYKVLWSFAIVPKLVNRNLFVFDKIPGSDDQDVRVCIPCKNLPSSNGSGIIHIYDFTVVIWELQADLPGFQSFFFFGRIEEVIDRDIAHLLRLLYNHILLTEFEIY